MIFGFSPNTNDEKESKVPLTKTILKKNFQLGGSFFCLKMMSINIYKPCDIYRQYLLG